MIILYNTVCLYHHLESEIVLYGQYLVVCGKLIKNFNSLYIENNNSENINYKLDFCTDKYKNPSRSDF